MAEQKQNKSGFDIFGDLENTQRQDDIHKEIPMHLYTKSLLFFPPNITLKCSCQDRLTK